jgi:hypothetical protein
MISKADYTLRTIWIESLLVSPGITSLHTYREFESTAELLNLHRGQGLDLLWRDSLQCPTEEEYIAMVNDS